MKYACGVVFYNPSKENVTRIESIKSAFDYTFVFDNTPNSVSPEKYNQYISTGKNEGLAVPYNEFIRRSLIEKIDFLCILDQDSCLQIDDVNRIIKYIEENYDPKTIIYAPRLKGSKNKDWCINSNTFINVKSFYKYNLRYDEKYFIDRLDADLCMQIKKKKINLKIIEDVIIWHPIGDENKGHSAIRHYYMFRNRLYYNFKYYNLLFAFIKCLVQSIRHFLLIALYENNRYDKITIIMKSIRDFIYNKMGRFDDA